MSRTSYACDPCRRQKIKCDGVQPCKKCSHNGLRCTYGSSNGRSAVGYTRHLEQKIEQLQALIRHQPQSIGDGSTAFGSPPLARQGSFSDVVAPHEDDHIVVSLEDIQNRFNGISGCPTRPAPNSKAFVEYCGAQMAEAFDSATFEMPMETAMAESLWIPSQSKLEHNVSIALDHALNCMECIDRNELWLNIRSLYAKSPYSYTEHDKSTLALVYALMALGRRHDPTTSQNLPDDGNRRLLVGGLGYFRASRAILDSLSCPDLSSIITFCYLANYLLSVSMMSKAYSYLSTAASAALRIGLSTSHAATTLDFTIDESNRRRRVFGLLESMDTVVSGMLGSPELLRHTVREQTPLSPESSLPDEHSTLIEPYPMVPLMEGMASAQLYQISSKMLQSDSMSSKHGLTPSMLHTLDYQSVTSVEQEVNAWHGRLPKMLPEDIDQRPLRSQMLLRLQHAAVELTLYRPFLHHLNQDTTDASFQYQGYAFGSSCLRASTQTVYIIESMDKQGFLHEAQWHTTYLLALAATSLMFFLLKWKEGPTVEESRAAYDRAIGLLATLGQNSISARRCHSSLLNLFRRKSSDDSLETQRLRFMHAIGAMETHEDPSLALGRR